MLLPSRPTVEALITYTASSPVLGRQETLVFLGQEWGICGPPDGGLASPTSLNQHGKGLWEL